MNILFFTHPGTNSRDIFLDIIEGYQQAGHHTFLLPLGQFWQVCDAGETEAQRQQAIVLFAKTVLGILSENNIHLCVSLWGNGAFAFPSMGDRDFFEYADVPLLMHWLDAPHWAHNGDIPGMDMGILNGSHKFHYINNQATAIEMDGVLGFKNIICLPNAASPTRFYPTEQQECKYDIVVSLGNEMSSPSPVMLNELKEDIPDCQRIRRDIADSVAMELEELLHKSFAESAKRFSVALVETQLRDRNQPIIDKFQYIASKEAALSPIVLGIIKNPRLYVDVTMRLRRMESWERKFMTCLLVVKIFQSRHIWGRRFVRMAT